MSKSQEGDKFELKAPTPLKTETAANSVKDLERRLQMMSQAEIKPVAVAAPKPAPAVQATTTTTTTTTGGGGKNALLVSFLSKI